MSVPLHLADAKAPCCDNVDPTAEDGVDFIGDQQAWCVDLKCLSCGHVTRLLVEHPWWPRSNVVQASSAAADDGGRR